MFCSLTTSNGPAKPGKLLDFFRSLYVNSRHLCGIFPVWESKKKRCGWIPSQNLNSSMSLGKPHGCQTFGDYAEVFIRNVTRQFEKKHITRVDVVFDLYIGEKSIKTAIPSKRVDTRKLILKTIDGTDIPLPQV